jgi:hypothetical protein
MAKQQLAHEEMGQQDDVKAGSDRNFGFVFAAFCAVVAGIQLWVSSGNHWSWFVAAGVFALLALMIPRMLHPLNLLWFKFGMLLHHVVSPIVLGLMFFVVFTPIGLWMRLIGKRPLNLRFDPKIDTYWIFRRPPGPPPGSFNDQF